MAVATIGPPSAFRPGEVPGMAGNDTSLIFAVSDWSALKNRDSTLVRNLTSMVSEPELQWAARMARHILITHASARSLRLHMQPSGALTITMPCGAAVTA